MVLGVSQNPLSNFDVSQNINLQELQFSNTNITSIDLSQNQQLTNLFCDNNPLTSLDLTNNTELYQLGVTFTNITSLDLTNNINLEYLNCNDTQITSLDLSQNNSLISLRCYNTPLSFLDLRNGNNYTMPGVTGDLILNKNPNLNCVLVDDAIWCTNNWVNNGWIVVDPNLLFVETEEECDSSGCLITVDILQDVNQCDSFILEEITNGNYFTSSGGNGTPLFEGDLISSSQTIYIYNQDPSDPTCFEESSFIITISDSPEIDIINDKTVCTEYYLPSLINGNYFTSSSGNGNALFEGDLILSSQTIYIYKENLINPLCSSESSFNVTINQNLNFDLTEYNLLIENQNLTINMEDTSIIYEYSLDGLTYQLSNQFYNLSPDTYQLYIKDINNCIEKMISLEIRDKDNLVPKYFTPNNDGVNDNWTINDRDNKISNVYIYNRYGKILKVLINNQLSWNGKHKGNSLPTNDYWYKILYKSGETKVGHFTLKR